MWIVYNFLISCGMEQRHEAGLICNFLSLGIGSPLAWWRGGREREREREIEYACIDVIYRYLYRIYDIYIYTHTHLYASHSQFAWVWLYPIPWRPAGSQAIMQLQRHAPFPWLQVLILQHVQYLSFFGFFKFVCSVHGLWWWLLILAPSGFPCSLFLQRQWGNAGVLACSPLSASKLNNYKRKMLALSYCIELWAN